jgi:hypothetical protein
MAKQDGLIPLIGTIDNLSFSKSPFGYLARKKTGPTRKAVLKDANFERTRENAADFKTAVHAGTLIRSTIRPILRVSTNVWLNGRMNALLLQAVRSDKTNGRGKRAILPSELSILKGFEINANNPISKRKGILCKTKKNARKGIIQITIPSFIPTSALTPPEAATHFKIMTIYASINFTKTQLTNDLQNSDLLAISRRKTKAFTFQRPIINKEGQAQLLAVGIAFYKMVDGLEKLLKGGAAKILEAGDN